MARSAVVFILVILSLSACGEESPPRPAPTPGSSGTHASDEVGVSPQKPRLSWSEPFRASKLGVKADALLEGKSLQAIIGSVVAGRGDGMLCSSCHHRLDAPGAYGLDVEPGAASPTISFQTVFTGRSWTGPDGWAVGFIKNSTKPENLKLMMQLWIDASYALTQPAEPTD